MERGPGFPLHFILHRTACLFQWAVLLLAGAASAGDLTTKSQAERVYPASTGPLTHDDLPLPPYSLCEYLSLALANLKSIHQEKSSGYLGAEGGSQNI